MLPLHRYRQRAALTRASTLREEESSYGRWKLVRKVLDQPEETRSFAEGKGKAQVVKVGGVTLGRGIFEPGWPWSKHVKPIAKTDSCQAVHTGVVLESRDGVWS